MLLKDVFRRPVKLYPEKLAVIDGNRRLTFRELDARIDSLANALVSMGLRKGDRVGALLKNCAEYFEIIGAGARTGIVVVPINFRLARKELGFLLNDSQCSALILHAEYHGLIRELITDGVCVGQCVVIGDLVEGMHSYELLLNHEAIQGLREPLQEDDLAVILYTSGTTGFPKGAMATQRIMADRCILSAMEMAIRPDDRIINVLPMFHVSVVVGLAFLHMGATNVILPEWDPKAFCETVEREKVTAMSVAPTIVHFVVNYPEVHRYDLSSFRIIQYGGSPMAEATLRAGMALFQCDFLQALGSTENYTSILLKPEDHVLQGPEPAVRRLMAAGREAVMVNARVVNEKAEDISPGEVGEVITKGAANLTGYWNNAAATRNALRDGWYHTGDLATVDDEGYIFLLERRDDLIISGGENIYPKEVENILYSHPAIDEAAVIGVPDDDWGESVKALVILHEGQRLTEDEVIRYCRENLASYKKPKSVEFVDDLPRNASGKVLKKKLSEKYWPGKRRAGSDDAALKS
jgi:long-chain acyl-CoA synthetase